MPLSKKQLAWANATHQPFAQRWNREARGKNLPERSKGTHERKRKKHRKLSKKGSTRAY